MHNTRRSARGLFNLLFQLILRMLLTRRISKLSDFLPTVVSQSEGVWETTIKDLRRGMAKTEEEHKKFLHQYLTLTRCDLFFTDKAILIEGLAKGC